MAVSTQRGPVRWTKVDDNLYMVKRVAGWYVLMHRRDHGNLFWICIYPDGFSGNLNSHRLVSQQRASRTIRAGEREDADG